jgi:hypothetical protein
MSNPNKPEDGLAGGKSGAGVSPMPSSPMPETDDMERRAEPRSFQSPEPEAAADQPLDQAPDAVKRASDGDEQRSKPLGR